MTAAGRGQRIPRPPGSRREREDVAPVKVEVERDTLLDANRVIARLIRRCKSGDHCNGKCDTCSYDIDAQQMRVRLLMAAGKEGGE